MKKQAGETAIRSKTANASNRHSVGANKTGLKEANRKNRQSASWQAALSNSSQISRSNTPSRFPNPRGSLPVNQMATNRPMEGQAVENHITATGKTQKTGAAARALLKVDKPFPLLAAGGW